MTLAEGVYTIENFKNRNWAILVNADDGGDVVAGTDADENAGEKWYIRNLSNGSYLLHNQRYETHATYGPTDTSDDRSTVLSKRTGIPGQWHIKPSEDSYIISDLADRCWTLRNDYPYSPVSLEEYGHSDRQHWRIMPEGGVIRVSPLKSTDLRTPVDVNDCPIAVDPAGSNTDIRTQIDSSPQSSGPASLVTPHSSHTSVAPPLSHSPVPSNSSSSLNMATAHFDVASVIQQVKEFISVVRDEERRSDEKETNARLAVYHVLAIHPAIDQMKSPTSDLGDLDWFTEMKSSLAFLGGSFKRMGQNHHFKRTSLLGEVGRRARIMMLLCWVIGFRLSHDKICQLLSTAVGDALVFRDGIAPVALHHLVVVNKVLEDLSRMMATRLPLPPERNPFYGSDFVRGDEDNIIPREKLWAYGKPGHESLSAEERFEFDVKQNPTILLRPLASRVLVPQTKLSLLMIQWATHNFGLGKKVNCRQEIDPSVFWNADPPRSPEPAIEPSIDYIQAETDLADAEMAYSDSQGSDRETDLPRNLNEAMEDLPLEEWIHARFCHTYGVHGWAHDRFVRTLLFSTFCGCQCLPTFSDVLSTYHVAKELRLRLGDDVLAILEPIVLLEGTRQWKAIDRWKPRFKEMTAPERGMAVMFSDAVADYTRHDQLGEEGPQTIEDVKWFLIEPTQDCPDQSDILSIPILKNGQSSDRIDIQIPDFGPIMCACGRCPAIHASLQRYTDRFSTKYQTFIASAKRRGCDAFGKTWDLLLTDAEKWFETLMMRIDAPFDLFPYASERRPGIAIVEALLTMGRWIGVNFTTRQLLGFVTLARSCHASPSYFRGDDMPVLRGSAFAFVTTPDCTDENLPEDQEREYASLHAVLSTAGGWLYDFPDGGLDDQNAFISFSDAIKIRYLSDPEPDIQVIRMPELDAIPPIRFPRDHTMIPMVEVPRLPSTIPSAYESVTIDLSQDSKEGFPLLNSGYRRGEPLLPPPDDDMFGVQLSTTYSNRMIKTWWRPRVQVGQPCTHFTEYGRMNCCSLTSNQVLLQIPPGLSSESSNVEIHDKSEADQGADIVARFFAEQERLTSRLTEPHAPFERGRMCIVRCGETEGPVDPLILLGGSLGMKAYIFHYKECWRCAVTRMHAHNCTLGVALGTKIVTHCTFCAVADERARDIISHYEN